LNWKSITLGLLAVVALYVLYDQFKGDVVGDYVDHYMPRPTATPSSADPDQVALTWSDEPTTTMAVQFRTHPDVTAGWVEFGPNSDAAARIEATRRIGADKLVENDPVNSRFAATMTGLEPGTDYRYRVGSPPAEAWSAWRTFTTAPAETEAFSFVYLGDPQLGLDTFGETLDAAYAVSPGAVFTVIAGDLVNSGSYRSEWDDFFANGDPWFARRPLIPALGNHDYDPDAPYLYLDLFTLRTNGPANFPPERAYHFSYGNALFVVLDSNIRIADQTAWLEKTLAEHEDAVWKFAIYHHPAYSSRRARDNAEVRELWGALFDEYHVDLAFQGHDHAYLRTYPMRGGERVESAAEGTYYVVSVSGTKYYDQEARDYTAVGFEETSTYQIIDIETNPDRLTYVAYDLEGNERDRIEIAK